MALFSFPERVNERAARLVAAIVATTLVGAWLTGLRWVVPLMALGFLLRVGWGPKVSPLARVAVTVAPRLWSVRLVAGAPKRFAQGIGAACTLCASALFLAGHDTSAWIVSALVVLFATLEASVGFCAGCYLYAQLTRAGLFPEPVCIDCVPAPAAETDRDSIA